MLLARHAHEFNGHGGTVGLHVIEIGDPWSTVREFSSSDHQLWPPGANGFRLGMRRMPCVNRHSPKLSNEGMCLSRLHKSIWSLVGYVSPARRELP